MGTNYNPLLGWAGQSGVNQPSAASNAQNAATSASTGAASGSPLPPNINLTSPTTTNPYGFGSLGGGALKTNLAESNLQTAEQRNALIPQFANTAGAYGGAAGQYFNQLMNLGSPYYQQAQQSVFNQGVQQANSQGAQARQQLNAQGYGFTPSGAMAGMLGGMATGTSGNLAQNFLQQLFNNEQLQAQGAQGLSSLASIFNPAQLTSQQTNPSVTPTGTTLATDLAGIGSLLQGMGSLKPSSSGG